MSVGVIQKINNHKSKIKKNISNITFNFTIEEKIIKEKVGKDNNFNSVLQEFILNKILDKDYKKNNILLGTIFASELYNSFNGLGIIPYFVNNKSLSTDINNKIKKNFYLGLSGVYSNLQKIFKINPEFDIVFSGVKFTDTLNCINNSKIQSIYTYMPYHKAPIYILTNKCANYIFVSIGVKNKKISDNLKKKYNWNYIVE
jgi:hypothetical protein